MIWSSCCSIAGVEVDLRRSSDGSRPTQRSLKKQIRPHLRMSNGSWRVDETYIRVKGRWTYLYRAVDSRGQTIDFLLSARRDTAAAKRFFRKAIAQRHIVNPRTLHRRQESLPIPRAVADMKSDGQLWRRTRLRQCKYLNNIVEQDHRRIKRLVRPGLGFGSFRTARQTLAGFETMAMMRKGQVRERLTVMISAAKPPLSPTCSTGPHERPEPGLPPPRIVSQYRCNGTGFSDC